MPTLASIWRARPWIVNGSSSALRSLRATEAAAAESTTLQVAGRRTRRRRAGRRCRSRAAPRGGAPCLLEELVAARMTERVVDLLEAIEVHDHHRGGDVLTACDRERLSNPVVEERPVREVGQRVVERLMLVDLGLVSQGPRPRRRSGRGRCRAARARRRSPSTSCACRADARVDRGVGDRQLHGALRPSARPSQSGT